MLGVGGEMWDDGFWNWGKVFGISFLKKIRAKLKVKP
jgi:hypothetical protein